MRRRIYFWVKENVNSDTVRLAILAIPLDAHTSVGFNGFVMTSDRQSIPFIYHIRHSASGVYEEPITAALGIIHLISA